MFRIVGILYLLANAKRMNDVTRLLNEALQHPSPPIESVFTVAIESFARDGLIDDSLYVCLSSWQNINHTIATIILLLYHHKYTITTIS